MIEYSAKHLKFEIIQDVNYDNLNVEELAWLVTNKYTDISLGVIEWCDKEHWNKFAFFPKVNTLFEEDCLRDIANFCVLATSKVKYLLERGKGI